MNDLNQAISEIVEKETAKISNDVSKSFSAMDMVVEQIMSTVKAELINQLKKQFFQLDFNQIVHDLVAADLENRIKEIAFPDNSIPASSIDTTGLTVSANDITQGTITGFSSTGIEDQANETKLTVMDRFVVVENRLVAQELKVIGSTILEGNLIIKGQIPTDSKVFTNLVAFTKDAIIKTFNDDMLVSVADNVKESLLTDGLELSKLVLDSKTVLEGNALGKTIVESNLQKVGHLKELQVQGETLLSGSLYTTHSRVGINTTSPASALAVWDEETEVVIGKHKQQTGYIGSARSQAIAFGCNSIPHITLTPDGNTQVSNIRVKNVKLSSAVVVPKEAGEQGEIRFNENPEPGEYIGWVCLGGTRWFGFGEIHK